MNVRVILHAVVVTCAVSACAAEETPAAPPSTEPSSVCGDSQLEGDDCISASLLPQQATQRYQRFLLQTGTALHQTGDNFEFAMARNRDLVAIKKNGTGSGMTEVHILSAASNYQSFSFQGATALHETGRDFEFALTADRDLVAIKKRGTGTRSTEVHILSATSGYRTFVLQTGTALHETDDAFEFELANNRDLYAFKKRGTGSGKTEVHILSASSNYQSFSLQKATALPETDSTYKFLLTASNWIQVMKKSGTATGSTEALILLPGGNPSNSYTDISLQIGTALHETNDTFDFALAPNGDLVAIKKSGTGTGSTELHIL